MFYLMFIIIHFYYYVIYFKYIILNKLKYYNIYTYRLIQNLLTHV
jgi:hypothetical protein